METQASQGPSGFALLFHIRHTPRGVAYLLHRAGWTLRVPVRRAVERDEGVITSWVAGEWPVMTGDRRTALGLDAWLCWADEAG
ncbi:hypothetical protein GCM10010517_25950 [Streptosporangium fragile]|uniref:Winged helix-turn helix domain-containing protein n=1 Tax=Streptosporangium fragile TaxID=46186 RepID=A0ABP6IBR2_9ACTN